MHSSRGGQPTEGDLPTGGILTESGMTTDRGIPTEVGLPYSPMDKKPTLLKTLTSLVVGNTKSNARDSKIN